MVQCRANGGNGLTPAQSFKKEWCTVEGAKKLKGLRENSSTMVGVILGNSGFGKSTTINNMITPRNINLKHPGAPVGTEEEGSITKNCALYEGFIHDQKIDLIDT